MGRAILWLLFLTFGTISSVNVIKRTKRLVVFCHNLQIPEAILHPRGKPVKNAGKRKKSWYERGPAASKRKYSCSLCRSETHSATDCPLKQLYGDENPK